MVEFLEFPKIGRLSRMITITEKIDGTNAQVYIGEDGEILFGSRTRWVTPENDNYGFARWGTDHKDELMGLGPGRHYGEWWGLGIQRNYGMKEKHFSLFNVGRWNRHNIPACCDVVPILYQGEFTSEDIARVLELLHVKGSMAAPGFMKPEGIVIYHSAIKTYFKKTLEKDYEPKSMITGKV